MELFDLPAPTVDNKFHRGNGDDGLHYWLTPWEHPTFVALSNEFGPFDYDPCPYPKPDGFDGLTCEWTGTRIYMNPPFGSIIEWPAAGDCLGHETKTPKSSTCIHCGAVGKKKGPTAWINKAIEEWKKGDKTILIVFPIDKWILKLLKVILGEHAQVRNLGDVRWLSTETGLPGKGTGRHIACFILEAQS